MRNRCWSAGSRGWPPRRRTHGAGAVDHIPGVAPGATGAHRGVELVVGQHHGQALVRRNAMELDALGGLESRAVAVAELLGPLHVPLHAVLGDAEVVLQ